MLGRRLWVAVLSVVMLLGMSAVAQDEKNEIGGISGAHSSATRESRERRISIPLFTPAKV